MLCSREEVAAVYNTPLLDLVYKAASVHRMYNDPQMVCLLGLTCHTLYALYLHTPSFALQVQRCTLLSIKTGGCPETCNYCAQSSSWSKDVGLKAEKLMDLDSVYEVMHTCQASVAFSANYYLSTKHTTLPQAALRAKEAGSTRFCMGAAWRGPSQVCHKPPACWPPTPAMQHHVMLCMLDYPPRISIPCIGLRMM